MSELEQRLVLLETRIAHLEDSLQQLSDAFYVQQRELDKVAARNAQLLAELDSQPGGTPASQHEKPPHY